MIAAIVPAAGKSLRMGRPKLTLPVLGVPVIARVVRALIDGGADRVVVVVAPLDEPGAAETALAAREAGAIAFHLDQPSPDMRTTIERGIDHLANLVPQPLGILLAPADFVGINAEVVRTVRLHFLAHRSRMVVPVHRGERGHPLTLPWHVARAIEGLPPGVGVNTLLSTREAEVDRVEVENMTLTDDLDTPEDYARWQERRILSESPPGPLPNRGTGG